MVFIKRNQAGGLTERQVGQQDGFDEAENGGIGAHAKCEREYGDHRESRAATQGAEAVAYVLCELIPPHPFVRFVEGFARTGDVAKGQACASRSFRPGNALGNQTFCLECNMRGNFCVEIRWIPFHASPGVLAMAGSGLAGSMMLPIAATRRFQRVISRASSLRARDVSRCAS